MDPSVAIQFIVLIVLLLLSAFFSSAETSLVTVNQIRMRSLADEGNKKQREFLKLHLIHLKCLVQFSLAIT